MSNSKAVLITFYELDRDAFVFVVPNPKPYFLKRLREYGAYVARRKNKALWESAASSSYYFEILMLAHFLQHVGGMGPKPFTIDRYMKAQFSELAATLREDLGATDDELRAFRDAMTGWKGVNLQAITSSSHDVMMPVNVMINTAYTFPAE